MDETGVLARTLNNMTDEIIKLRRSETGKIMQRRIQDGFMKSGVTIVDPPNTWIDARTQIGQDSIIEPFTYIHGQVKIGSNCRVGPFAYLRLKLLPSPLQA